MHRLARSMFLLLPMLGLAGTATAFSIFPNPVVDDDGAGTTITITQTGFAIGSGFGETVLDGAIGGLDVSLIFTVSVVGPGALDGGVQPDLQVGVLDPDGGCFGFACATTTLSYSPRNGAAPRRLRAWLMPDLPVTRIDPSGQDSQRGTFFHRHAVSHNQRERGTHTPLKQLSDDQANFRVINSLLSEEAVLAFEYGYSTAEPETLVIWEAQFGDFVNGAQVVIDQFLSSSEAKWGRYCGLVMMLPHGYDGQGPEHSSARLERFLQLCAEENIQVCMPSTPAQMFHLLRRQMIRNCRKPLIVMTPKSLLRHKMCTSSLDDLASGYYQRVLPEVDPIDPKQVKHIILCCGKVYYELLEKRRLEQRTDVAIIRVEQLYPFPGPELDKVLAEYTETQDIVWVQEEPKNQGGWDFAKPRIPAMLSRPWDLFYIGRESSSAPAVGSAKLHGVQQRELVDDALNFNRENYKSVRAKYQWQ